MDIAKRFYNEDFCTLSNINDTIKNLSEELYVTGLPALPDYNVQKTAADQHNIICNLANALWALIQLNRRTMELKRKAEVELMTLHSDNNSLKTKVKDMAEELCTAKSKIRIERVKNKQMEMDRDIAKEEVKTLKGVVETLRKDLQSKCQLYSREIKKSCDESVKLRRRLNSSLAKGTSKISVTKSCTNQDNDDEERGTPSVLEHGKLKSENLPTASGKDALCKHCTTDNISERKEELYKKSIHRLQNTITSLVNEAYTAQRRYVDLSCEVVTLVNQHIRVRDEDNDHRHFSITKSSHVTPSDFYVIDEYTRKVLQHLKTDNCKC